MSRSEIKAKIYNYNAKIKECRTERDKYKKSLKYAKDLLSNLTNSKDYILKAESSLKNSYAMAGKIGKYDDIQDIKKLFESSINDLNNIVIPGIDGKIRLLESTITRYESRVSGLWDDYNACSE